jgi:hypothetical protein
LNGVEVCEVQPDVLCCGRAKQPIGVDDSSEGGGENVNSVELPGA